jgi:ribosome-binding protein aMBF1 (putative translation factor)
MARCAVCSKPEENVQLFDGVYDGRVSHVCFTCAQREGIVLIKKPTPEQLAEAQKRKSVKELIQNISSPQKRIMPKDQILAHKSLAKLKFPGMKQEHGDLVHNYDWALKQARRHSKLSANQVAQKIGFDKAQVESLESGQLFAGFEKVAYALENLYNIKVLTDRDFSAKIVKHEQKQEVQHQTNQENVSPTSQKNQSILDSVRAKMGRHNFLVHNKSIEQIGLEADREIETTHELIDIDSLREQKKQERVELPQEDSSLERAQRRQELSEDIKSERYDFSKKENLDKIRIQDLAQLKKMKTERERLED